MRVFFQSKFGVRAKPVHMPCFKGFLCNVAFLFNSRGFNREHSLSIEDLVCDAFLHCGCRLVKFCLLLTSDESHNYQRNQNDCMDSSDGNDGMLDKEVLLFVLWCPLIKKAKGLHCQLVG